MASSVKIPTQHRDFATFPRGKGCCRDGIPPVVPMPGRAEWVFTKTMKKSRIFPKSICIFAHDVVYCMRVIRISIKNAKFGAE